MRTYKLISLLLLVCSIPLYAQKTMSVSGSVYDDNNAPLIGATVMVKGTTNGTIVDVDGRYSLTVKEGDVLQAVFTGFISEEVTVGKETKINFLLREDRQLLDEVVVIGYGAAKKSDLTGSVTSVKMNDIKEVPAYSVDNAMQGRVAGAEIMSTTGEPGATTTIRIRGTRSVEASNEPLIVVDGIVDAIADLNDINPEDIESITVLKDASSTAIYGARGANGVILITTRQGGGSLSRPNVSFNASVGFSQLPRKLDLMNASEFARYRNDYAMLGSEDPKPNTPVSGLTYKDPLSLTGTDWIDEVTRTGLYQNYSVSASGRDKDNNYLVSLSYNDNQGIMDGTGQERISGRVKYTRKFYKWMSVSYNGFYTWRKQNPAVTSIGGTSQYKSAQYLSPMIKPTDSINELEDDERRFDNPRAIIDNTTYDRIFSTTTNTFTFDITPIKNMAIKSQFSYSDFRKSEFKYVTGDLPTKAENDGGEATRIEVGETSLSNETTIRYTYKKKQHTLTPLLGFSAYSRSSNTLSATGKGYSDDNVMWNNMVAVPDKSTYSTSTSYYAIQKLSAFARVDYNYRSRYYLTLTGRYDGASNFAANNKWAFFPSAAFRWTISKEKFMKRIWWLDDLSLRLSAGRTGNDAISAYRSLAALTASSKGYVFDGMQPAAFYQHRAASPNLTWEKTDQYNVGIDAAFFRKRLNITAEAYYSKTTDLLLKVQLPIQTGFESRYENIGVTSNKGLELTIESVNIDRKNFQWLTSFTMSHNTQMVEDIGDVDYVEAYVSPSQKYMMYGYVKGYPLNSLWGFEYGGVWKSNEEVTANKESKVYASTASSPKLGSPRYYDQNNDGTLNHDDLVYLGNADPILYGGLQNTFYWKGLKLGVYFVYSLGGRIYNISELFMSGSTSTNQYRYMLDAWHPVRNPNSDLPRAGQAAGAAVPCSYMVHDASYLRLKTLSLAYTFDFRKKDNFLFREITVGVSGDNIYLWKYYNGFDPDISSEGTSSILRRADIGAYPKARTFMFNLNLKF